MSAPDASGADAELDQRTHNLLDFLAATDAPGLAAVQSGQFPYNSTSLALESVRQVKPVSGILFGFSGYSTVSQYVQVFDLDADPGSGAIPVVVIPVGANAPFSYNATVSAPDIAGFARGRRFQQGIVIANSSTGPAYTAGGSTIWVDAQYV